MAPNRRATTAVAAALVLALVALAAACTPGGGGGGAEGLPPGYRGYVSATYRDDANWLCRPGKADDVCAAADLDATVAHADGTTEVEPHTPADDPPVDCFYLYPSVSLDPPPNADLVPGPQELGVVVDQAARFDRSCRVFAPMYRQVPLTMAGQDVTAAFDVAYRGVVDAFKHYVANDSDGRGFVLYGHSQGALHLTRLIQEEIEDQPTLRRRLVSALIIGTELPVPEGEVVGGTFERTPLCEAADQTGCVVAYASFRATAPPPPDAVFGRPDEPGMVAACVNPASLGHGDGDGDGDGPAFLTPYSRVPALALEPYVDPALNARVTTPWYTAPGLVSGECAHHDGASYLAVTVHGDPADPRMDQIGGDFLPQWGLHLIDVNLTIGDLVDLVATQGAAHAARLRGAVRG